MLGPVIGSYTLMYPDSTVKKPPSKSKIRSQINQQVDDFLERGGKVDAIPRGLSGRDPADGPIKPSTAFFTSPKAERTFLPEVVAALDERKKSRKIKPLKPKPKKPRKKIIYDDFGEPLRWEWVDE